MHQTKRVIIIGGGFAGLHLARKLNKKYFSVLLIDKQNHHQFQPLFYQVASARLEPSSISFPFRKIFQNSKNVEYRWTEVLRISPEQHCVETTIGSFPYDNLVIATGCRTNFFGNRTLEFSALSMKTTEESLQIRNRILETFERIISSGNTAGERLYNIVITGALVMTNKIHQ
jgi:NADH dehydrogenase